MNHPNDTSTSEFRSDNDPSQKQQPLHTIALKESKIFSINIFSFVFYVYYLR